jgi:hypothetical protein
VSQKPSNVENWLAYLYRLFETKTLIDSPTQKMQDYDLVSVAEPIHFCAAPDPADFHSRFPIPRSYYTVYERVGNFLKQEDVYVHITQVIHFKIDYRYRYCL